MKKILSVLLCALCIGLFFAGCSKTEYTYAKPDTAADLTVVSFNCAAPWGNILDKTSSASRVKRFAAYMNAVKPDSIGTQEMNAKWQTKLSSLMADYDSYGVKRGGDDNENKSEMNCIFWLKDKYTCMDKNTFWLSETPETESKYEGAGCNRVCSYVVLKNNENGRIYIHFNTHLDNASDEARVFGASVILDKLEEISKNYSGAMIVLSGDFNDIESGKPCSLIAEKLTSCSSANSENKTNTYTDWGNLQDTSGEPIDFIFTDMTPVTYDVLDDLSNGYVSDHFGIIAQINY